VSEGRPRRVEPWPWIVVGLLAAMMSGSVAFYRIAAVNPDPVVVDDTWRAGRAYSERVRAARRAESRGWDLEVRTEPAHGGLRVVVSVPVETAGPETLSVRRVRPAEGGLDARFPLAAAPDGETWTGDVPLPRPGRWHLVVRAESEGEGRALERTLRVWMPADSGGAAAGDRRGSDAASGPGPAGVADGAPRRGGGSS